MQNTQAGGESAPFIILVTHIAFAFFAGITARKKGNSFWLVFIFSIFIPLLGVILFVSSLFLSDKKKAPSLKPDSIEKFKKCFFCAEPIRMAAILCRFCGRDVVKDARQSKPVIAELSEKPKSEILSLKEYQNQTIKSSPETSGYHPNWWNEQHQKYLALQSSILPEYLETVFCAEPAPVESLVNFHIITAFNPKKILTEQENHIADTRLRTQLEQEQVAHFRITGCSADFTHQEASWAIIGISLGRAIEIGRQYGQNAIFEVRDGEVFVVSCETLERLPIGPFQERLKKIPNGTDLQAMKLMKISRAQLDKEFAQIGSTPLPKDSHYFKEASIAFLSDTPRQRRPKTTSSTQNSSESDSDSPLETKLKEELLPPVSVDREQDPLIFFRSAFETTISHSFQESRLWSQQTAERLGIAPDDEESLSKFRVSAISMVLFITLRGIQEAFLRNFQQGFRSKEGLLSVMKNSAEIFHTLMNEEAKKTAQLPKYVDAHYFSRWWLRYDEKAIAPDALPLRPSTLTMFLTQATFTYGIEPRIKATDTAILAQGEDVYDNYVIGLRNHFGKEILR